MSALRILPLSLVLVVLLVGRAHAYLDAGSGSMLVQLLFGGTAGLVVLVKLYWRRLLSLLGVQETRSDAAPEADAKRAD